MSKLCLQEVLNGLHRGMTYVNCNCSNAFTHDCLLEPFRRFHKAYPNLVH
jgi:hypothetical protein